MISYQRYWDVSKIPWNLERGKATCSYFFPTCYGAGCVFLGASCRRGTYHNIIHVGKTTINHPGLGMLNIPPIKMVIWGMVYGIYPEYDF